MELLQLLVVILELCLLLGDLGLELLDLNEHLVSLLLLEYLVPLQVLVDILAVLLPLLNRCLLDLYLLVELGLFLGLLFNDRGQLSDLLLEHIRQLVGIIGLFLLLSLLNLC